MVLYLDSSPLSTLNLGCLGARILFFFPSLFLFTEKVKRAPSAYNLFMKSELAKVKAKQPSLTHAEAFKAAAGNVCYYFNTRQFYRMQEILTKVMKFEQWKSSPQNPANKK